jgi:hypothetical protein
MIFWRLFLISDNNAFKEMIRELGLLYAYHHFSEGESPNSPFLLFLSPGENTFGEVWLKTLLKEINDGEWKLTGMVRLSELKFSITKTVIGIDKDRNNSL